VGYPWFIGGDFNISRIPIERSGATHLCPSMVEFSDFILEQGFMDLPFAGGECTPGLGTPVGLFLTILNHEHLSYLCMCG
jgi:hypothetical protein